MPVASSMVGLPTLDLQRKSKLEGFFLRPWSCARKMMARACACPLFKAAPGSSAYPIAGSSGTTSRLGIYPICSPKPLDISHKRRGGCGRRRLRIGWNIQNVTGPALKYFLSLFPSCPDFHKSQNTYIKRMQRLSEVKFLQKWLQSGPRVKVPRQAM